MRRWQTAALLGGSLGLVALVVGLWIFGRAPDHAILLVTIDDCTRAFDEAQCRAIVERAQSIHASTAPNFERAETCELLYGTGGCSALKQGLIDLHGFAPTMVAILVTPERDGIVPIYYGSASAADPDAARPGRPVYYHGALVGRLMQPKIGGAAMSFVADRAGDALTADAVRKLHGP